VKCASGERRYHQIVENFGKRLWTKNYAIFALVGPLAVAIAGSRRSIDVLWAMEEALRCRAVGLVIGELRARDIDQVATRRLALAAAAGNTLGLLLRPAPDDTLSAAATRCFARCSSAACTAARP